MICKMIDVVYIVAVRHRVTVYRRGFDLKICDHFTLRFPFQFDVSYVALSVQKPEAMAYD